MTTFRELLLTNNGNYESNNLSSLDEWFSRVLDVSFDELEVGDVARAIRQELFLKEIFPRAEVILKKNPLAGEDYDGQLISSIASLSSDEAKNVLPFLLRIGSFLNHLDKTTLDSQKIADIEKINKLSHN